MNYLAISKKSGHSTKLGIIAQSVLMKMVTCDWTFSVWSCSLLLNNAAEEDNAVEMKRDRGALNMMMWIKKWHVRAINKRELRWHAVFVSKNVVKMFSLSQDRNLQTHQRKMPSCSRMLQLFLSQNSLASSKVSIPARTYNAYKVI